MSHTEKYAHIELCRIVLGEREFRDVEVEHIGPLCRIASLGVSFPISSVVEFIHAKPAPQPKTPTKSPERASRKKAEKKPAKAKPPVRTPKKVRPKSE